MSYPNMSYCMFENTSLALDQILGELQETVSSPQKMMDFFNNLSRTEKNAMSELYDMCNQYMALANDIWDECNQSDSEFDPGEYQEWHDFDPYC